VVLAILAAGVVASLIANRRTRRTTKTRADARDLPKPETDARTA
jgi:hypothetical protein